MKLYTYFYKNVSSVFRGELFNGKTAIVTGGGSGIGKAVTEELLYLGRTVQSVGVVRPYCLLTVSYR